MDIPGLSMAMAQTNVMSKVGTAVLSKTMDTSEAMASQVVDMIDRSAMEVSVNPHIGSNFDVSV